MVEETFNWNANGNVFMLILFNVLMYSEKAKDKLF